MTYDDWKLESPEEEEYRLSNSQRRAKSRAEWMEEHADYLLEERPAKGAEKGKRCTT
jgi:hypothetical protein